MPTSVNPVSHEAILPILEDDVALCKVANERRRGLFSAPIQSNFRVYCILVIENADGKLEFVDGANVESGYIGGSICAERAALSQLRMFHGKVTIKKIVVVTDSKIPLAPGMLCREFLHSYADVSTPVVCATDSGDIVTTFTLGSIYPHVFIYRNTGRSTLLDEGAKMAALIADTVPKLGKIADMVYSKAQQNVKLDNTEEVHPLSLAAAVVFEDDEVEVAWQLKGVEYGCTVDPITQLIRDMERRRICGFCETKTTCDVNGESTKRAKVSPEAQRRFVAMPKMLVMTDQFGVAHAPFAQARSLLTEHGYGELQIIVHSFNDDLSAAEAVIVTANDLAPQPEGSRILCGADFA